MTTLPLRRRGALRALLAGSSGPLLPTLSGCGAVSAITTPAAPPPPVMVVPGAVFELVADADLNPDAQGKPKPVLLRLYELKAGAGFERASFLDLMEKDEAALGADFVRREEWLIRPGERRTIDRKGNAEVRSFGVLAAFRDLERSSWRTVIDAPGSVEMRRRFLGLGAAEKLLPVRYRITLTRDAVRVEHVSRAG
ncbi:MAG TPA: type VI secretion system lipoprotein TssJ [Rubrivivax sp.]|nr:type VI secretion system lipoprotein TssJ [Burkholderiales bacterium]HNT39607.1 type VI secretion system lipoprotein TssJ [Rubrivivax sp.]